MEDLNRKVQKTSIPDFENLLLNHGLLNIAGFVPQTKEESIEKENLMLRMMTDVQKELMPELVPDQLLGIQLVGQSHGWHEDAMDAKARVEESVENQEVVIVERSGNVHPRYTNLVDVGESVGATVITESGICPQSMGLSEKQRGWLLGMYIANYMVENPDKSIVVIVGENHLKDIEMSIEFFLRYVGYSGEVGIQSIPSHHETNFSENVSKRLVVNHNEDGVPEINVITEGSKNEVIKLLFVEDESESEILMQPLFAEEDSDESVDEVDMLGTAENIENEINNVTQVPVRTHRWRKDSMENQSNNEEIDEEVNQNKNKCGL